MEYSDKLQTICMYLENFLESKSIDWVGEICPECCSIGQLSIDYPAVNCRECYDTIPFSGFYDLDEVAEQIIKEHSEDPNKEIYLIFTQFLFPGLPSSISREEFASCAGYIESVLG